VISSKRSGEKNGETNLIFSGLAACTFRIDSNALFMGLSSLVDKAVSRDLLSLGDSRERMSPKEAST
jgi:hypothetical protein